MIYEFERKKLYAYLGEDLVDTLKQHKCYIAGGTITSLFCNRDINDIDIYFRNEQSLIDFICDVWDDNQYVIAHTKKATLIKYGNVDIQLIHFGYFDSTQSIFDTFDYTVCMGAFDFATEEFTLHDDFLQHNSQRILKFNKSTAFPIVSLLRVQKYRDKGYTISKPEYIRIALACMNLNITSYAELKEQMGGMYGVNYDKLFTFDDATPFNMDTVIGAIADLCLDDDYFKKPVSLKFDNVDDIVDNIVNREPRYMELNKRWYKIRHNGEMESVSCKPDDVEVVDGEEYIRNLRLYKFVKKVDDRYFSHYDNGFEYVIGKQAEAREKAGAWYGNRQPSLYFVELTGIRKASYREENNSVLIEVSIAMDDWQDKDGCQITAKRCTVLREVPRDEYE
jgi:hypothetical protein